MVDPPDLGRCVAHRHDFHASIDTHSDGSARTYEQAHNETCPVCVKVYENGHLQPSTLSSLSKRALDGTRKTTRTCQTRSSSYSKISRVALVSFLLLIFASIVNGHVLPREDSGDLVARRANRDASSASSLANTDIDLEKRASLNWYSPLSSRNELVPRVALDDGDGDSSFVTRAGATHIQRRATTSSSSASERASTCACGSEEVPTGRKVGFGILVPILVVLSGIFAGLTLGYMSLDETQLQVLMTTGTDVQKARATKILPIRQDGHLLLTTLLIANMITNETLPIIFDPLLATASGGPVVSVVVSTVLIVIFAELIPQSTCSRYGLQIGAFMALPTRIIILILYPIAWPVSRILHFVLGPHHGIVYRRAELKELVTMHAASGGRGGDLKGDTVMIVGGALDLQEKVVKQAMTPIEQVFMLPFSARLDYPTLEQVVRSGHSRIPIYQEVEVTIHKSRSGTVTPRRKMSLLSSLSRRTTADAKDAAGSGGKGETQLQDSDASETTVRKKIIGTLLVKSCVLLDPEDAVPVSDMVINALPSVPWDEPLLNVLNAFQEGRSHMAIISSRSRRNLASESIADLGLKSNVTRGSQTKLPAASAAPRVDGLGDIDEEKHIEGSDHDRERRHSRSTSGASTTEGSRESPGSKTKSGWRAKLGLSGADDKEQTVPSDATIADAKAFEKATDPHELHKIDSRISVPQESDDGEDLPLGIITLEDVLEELLGEEILDEYDDRGNEEQDFRTLIPPPSPDHDFKMQIGEKEGALSDSAANDTQFKGTDGGVPSPPSIVPVQGESVTAMPQIAKKAMLKRLGLSGRQKGSSDVDAPSPVGTEAAGHGSEDPAPANSVDGSIHRRNRPDYIALPPATMESGGDFAQHSQRSSSVPPGSDAQQGATTGDDRQGWLNQFGTPVGSPLPLLTPGANRPVVVRTKGADGAEKTTLASENLLRGRAIGPATLQGGNALSPTGSLSAAATTALGSSAVAQQQQPPSSRSQTPVGNRGLRFKSQAVPGASMVTPTNAFTARPMGGQPRSRSQGGDAPSSRLYQEPLTHSGAQNSEDKNNDEGEPESPPLPSMSAGPTRTASPELLDNGQSTADRTSSAEGNPGPDSL